MIGEFARIGWLTLTLLFLAASCGSDDDGTTRPVVPRTYAAWRVPADFATIQPALDAASDGDTVLIAPGLYQGIGNRDLIVSDRAVCIVGVGGPDSCIIDCGPPEAAPHFFLGMNEIGPRSALVRGLTARNSRTENCCLVCWGGPVSIERCVIEDNRAGGGAVGLGGSLATVSDCVFRRNYAEPGNGGAAAVGSPNVTFLRCTFENNSGVEGGAIWVHQGTLRLVDCVLRGNFAYEQGGGLRASLSSVVLEGCTIVDNRSDWGGGAIYCSYGAISIDRCTIAGNSAVEGGALKLAGENGMVMSRSIVWGNCTPNGVDIYFQYLASISLESCVIDSTRIGRIDRCQRRGEMIYADPRFCSFAGCRKNGDFRLRSDSPGRLSDGTVLGSSAEECP